MMNENYIRQLIERFLNAETTLEEEQTLYEYFQGEEIADDLKSYSEAFQSFAAVKGIDKPVTKSTPAWVIALRTVTSMAAVFLIGLFVFVNEETPEAPQLTTATTQTEYMSNLCDQEFQIPSNSTPRELYMCYLETRDCKSPQAEQPSTYNLIKKMIYENEH